MPSCCAAMRYLHYSVQESLVNAGKHHVLKCAHPRYVQLQWMLVILAHL